jgi:hypothetical protein
MGLNLYQLKYTHGNKVNEILERDNYRCTCCKKDSDLCIDHIVPVKSGGKSTISNQRVLCRSCHSKITNTKEIVSPIGKYLREWRKNNPNYNTEYQREWRKKHIGYYNSSPEEYRFYKASL